MCMHGISNTIDSSHIIIFIVKGKQSEDTGMAQALHRNGTGIYRVLLYSVDFKILLDDYSQVKLR